MYMGAFKFQRIPLLRNEFEKILIESFEEAFKTKFSIEKLTNSEKDEAQKLKKEKFMKEEWNYKIG